MNLYEFNKSYVHARCKLYPGYYQKEIIRFFDPSKVLAVFGDNVERIGNGGQAVIRHTPCAFGICTKRSPTSGGFSYFADNRSIDRNSVIRDINSLHQKLVQEPNLIVYFPEHGIGTGLSEMPTRCPKLFDEMNEIIYERFGIDYRIKE